MKKISHIRPIYQHISSHIAQISTNLLSYLSNHKYLWLVLSLLSVCSIVDVPFTPTYRFNNLFIGIYLICVGSVKGLLLVFITAFVSKSKKVIRLFWWFALVIFAILCITNLVCYAFYGFGFSRRLLIIFAQTNPSEIREFIPGLMDNFLTLLKSSLFLVCLGAITLFFFLVNLIPNKVIIGLGLAGLILLSWFTCFIKYGKTANFFCLRIPKYTYEVCQTLRAYQAMADQLIPFPNPESVKSSRLAANVLMIIGESASKGHHSLYGYGINTNPFLTSIKDSIFIFTDAIGSSASTASNMERILTFKEDDLTDNDWFNYPCIIDLFNNAGYKTFYLSNQERFGLFSNASGALASSANVIKYMGAIVSEDAILQRFDEILIPEIKSALNDTAQSKFIIAHLIGSHTHYKNRFPKEFARISATDILSNQDRPWLNEQKAQIIADYDNSIAYTDSIIYQCISMLSSSNRPSVLLYFSDHGEHVYDTRDFIGRDEKFVEIPFIIYANKAYAYEYPDIIKSLKNAVNYPISSANVIYSMMTLTGTTYPMYNPKNDFLSPQFETHHRNVDEHPWIYE